MQIKYERGIKCIAIQSQEKYGHSSSFSALHPHQRFTLIPIFQSTKEKKMQCIILYGDPTPAGYTASSQIEVEIHSYML